MVHGLRGSQPRLCADADTADAAEPFGVWLDHQRDWQIPTVSTSKGSFLLIYITILVLLKCIYAFALVSHLALCVEVVRSGVSGQALFLLNTF